MFYTSAWCINNEEEFRKAIPFELLGESMMRHGSTLPFSIVILEGMEHLSARYIDSLNAYGFTVIDYCAEFSAIIERYPAIDRAYSRYERNCLLRWIAFQELTKKNGHEYMQFWHLDGDVILHTSLDELARDTKGKTFMLQGCPVLLTAADPRWFELFETELGKLNADISGYSAIAWQNKTRCLANDRLLANQSLYSDPLRSDQDLLEYLVSSKKIIQDDASVIYGSTFYFIQNPLSLSVWHAAQCPTDADFAANDLQEVLIGDKRVPFTHFQNTFSVYAGVYLMLSSWRVPRRMIRRIMAYSISDAHFGTTFAFRVCARIYRKLMAGPDRFSLITRLMQTKNGQRLADILNFLKPGQKQ